MLTPLKLSTATRRRRSRPHAILCVCVQESQIRRIFSIMINQKLEDFKEDVKPIGDILTQATLKLYSAVSAHFLPTPAKIHYLFNLRDISKVSDSVTVAVKARKTFSFPGRPDRIVAKSFLDLTSGEDSEFSERVTIRARVKVWIGVNELRFGFEQSNLLKLLQSFQLNSWEDRWWEVGMMADPDAGLVLVSPTHHS